MPPRECYSLTVRRSFSASHCLLGQGGKCENLHGHNFEVEVEVRGQELDPTTGMLLDFARLKTAADEVLARLDHTHLNNAPPLEGMSPSSENLARHIYKALQARLAGTAVRVHKVRVQEKPGQFACYWEE